MCRFGAGDEWGQCILWKGRAEPPVALITRSFWLHFGELMWVLFPEAGHLPFNGTVTFLPPKNMRAGDTAAESRVVA